MPQRKKGQKVHPVVQALPRRLLELRKRKGLSQSKLAITSKVTLSFLGKVERGEAVPGLDVLCRLADALNEDPAELISDPPPRELVVRRARQRYAETMDRLGKKSEAEVLDAFAVIADLTDNALSRRR